MVNIYKNEEILLSKSVFENRFWTFINVHFPVYLQGLEKSIFLVWGKMAYGLVWSKYQIFNYKIVTVKFRCRTSAFDSGHLSSLDISYNGFTKYEKYARRVCV